MPRKIDPSGAAPSRDYRSPLREDAKALTRRRIVEATVALHAEKGTLATSHADIAARAGVSVPTVYNHFPTVASLLPHCMGMVEATLPPIDEAAILAEPDRARRIASLVAAINDRHARLSPWLRWSVADAPRMPELAAALEAQQADQARLIADALAPAPRRKPPRDLLAVARTLLAYPAWQRLLAELGDAQAVDRAVIATLQCLSAAPPGAPR